MSHYEAHKFRILTDFKICDDPRKCRIKQSLIDIIVITVLATLCGEVAWVKRHYRDTLALDDLRDPQLLQENYTALDELTELLELGALYPFQQ